MRAKLDDVPLALTRRAARHLETIRGTELAPGSEAARLGDEACPIYRPDVRGIAYWEFEIAGVKASSRTGEKQKRGSRSGFLILAVNRGDAPIPHWSVELEPPSRALEAQSEKGDVAKVFKLDALAYVAEGSKGDYLTHLGQFPPMPEQPTSPPREVMLSSLEAVPARTTKDDERVGKYELKRTGVRAPKPRLSEWPSWGRVKKGYAAAYRPQLKALRAAKEPAWEIEDLIEKFGEGIHEGESLTVPLLRAGKAELAGGATRAVEMRRLDRDPPAVELLALKTEEKAEQELQLRLVYADGSEEMLTFFVVPHGAPSAERSVSPLTVPVPQPLGKGGRR